MAVDVKIQDEIDRQPDLAAAVREATKVLDEELGASGASVKADWTLARDENGRTLLRLQIADWTGSVGYRFAPEELNSIPHLKRRFHRLWGDLLQVRSHVELDDIWWHLQEQAE